MIALDTNCLLRFILADLPLQFAVVDSLLQRLQASQQQAYIAVPVLLEVIWVLKRKRTKQEIIDTIDGLLTNDTFVIEHHLAVREALERWRLFNADFTDYLIGALGRTAGCSAGASFDQALQTSDRFFRKPEDAA